MEIFPAIDLRCGRVVRLIEGDYVRMTVYSSDPVGVAKDFINSKAHNLHVVDLDGALSGQPENFEIISRLAALDNFVEVGGGIRDEGRIKCYLDAGVDRVILGTAAVKSPDFLESMIQKYGERIAVGVDAKDGFAAVDGWKKLSATSAFEFCVRLRDMGVATIIYTDISRDGKLAGANLDAYRRLAELKGLRVIASGGISGVSDIEELKAMGIYGAILGKALYSGKLDLKVALTAAEES